MSAATSKAASTLPTRAHSRMLLIALALTGFSMRTAVTSIGSVLEDIERDLHTSSGVAGVLTTLPVICFAGLGAATPWLASRFGPHRLLVAALLVSVIGLGARALAGSIWILVLLSALALAGGAVANVLLPSLVKLHFPDRIGAMTAVYSTALAVGTTAAAGLTVPIGEVGGGWRSGIGSWALFALIAVVPWLPTVVREVRPALGHLTVAPASLLRSRTAWWLTAFFAAQSTIAYMGFGWLARYLHAHGMSESGAGWMVALMSAVGIPVSMVVPRVPALRHRGLVVVLAVCWGSSFAGLGLAPVGGGWLWMVLYGIGNGMFPLALTMIGLRSRSAQTTAAVSAFTQVIGYVIAGLGPLLFGILYGATDSWVLPMSLMWIALAFATVAGWFACTARFVDDEIGRPAS